MLNLCLLTWSRPYFVSTSKSLYSLISLGTGLGRLSHWPSTLDRLANTGSVQNAKQSLRAKHRNDNSTNWNSCCYLSTNQEARIKNILNSKLFCVRVKKGYCSKRLKSVSHMNWQFHERTAPNIVRTCVVPSRERNSPISVCAEWRHNIIENLACGKLLFRANPSSASKKQRFFRNICLL